MSRQERRCTKCRRSIINHPGRYGPSCVNVPLPETVTLPDNSEISIQIDTPRDTHEGEFAFANEKPQSERAENSADVSNPDPAPLGAEQTTNASGQLRASLVAPAATINHRLVGYGQGMVNFGQFVPVQNIIHRGSTATSSVGTTYTWSQAGLQPRPTPTVQSVRYNVPVDVNLMAQQLATLQQQMAQLQGNTGIASHPWQAAQGGSHLGMQVPAQVSLSSYISPAQAGPTSHVGSQQIVYGQQPIQQIAQAGQPLAYGAMGGARGGAPDDQILPPAPAPVLLPVPGLKSLESLGDISRLPFMENISEKTARSALRGIYISLDEFLNPPTFNNEDQGEMLQILDSVTGIVTLKPKRQTRKIFNFATWLEAFMNYENLMVTAHGMIAYRGMAAYKAYIQKTDRVYEWSTVYSFDCQHRQSLSGKSIDFNELNTTLVAAVLTSASVKPQKCYRCKSTAHTTTECTATVPPTGPQSGGQARHRSRSRSKQPSKQSGEICRKFNTVGCTYVGCNKMHRCISCKGELPYNECIFRGQCKDHIQGKPKP